MEINFFSSKYSNETRTTHRTSSNIEIMIGNDADETIKNLSESLLQNMSRGIRKINEMK